MTRIEGKEKDAREPSSAIPLSGMKFRVVGQSLEILSFVSSVRCTLSVARFAVLNSDQFDQDPTYRRK